MVVTRYLVFFIVIVIASAENIIWSGNSAKKCDFSPKDDFASYRSGVQDCPDICARTYGCTHYVWSDLVGGGTCHLKHDPYITKYDAYESPVESAVCGINNVTVNWHGENWALRCDFPNDDFEAVPSVKEECQRICSTNEKCTHFTWSLNGGGTCYLKHNIHISKDNAFKSTNKSAICGIVNQTTIVNML